MISSTSIASILATQPRREVLGAVNTADLVSATFARVRAEGRAETEAERNQISDEMRDVTMALVA